MHQLWQHQNGYYYVLHGPRLKRRISTKTKDRGNAERFLARYITVAEEPRARVTVGTILTGYRDQHGPQVRSPDAIKYAVASLLKSLDGLYPSHLTPSVITKYAKDRGAKPGTVLREIGTLRAALAWAARHQWITKEERPIISSPVAAPPARERWMTKEEARALLAECHDMHLRLFVMLGLMTVARMGAILEAKWDQVNFERRTIDYGAGHGNKRRAVVPLNADLFKALEAAKTLSCSDFIIEYQGKRVFTVKNSFSGACGRAGLAGVTPHILRHTGATWMALDAVPMRQIAQMLGDSERTVERVYAKYHPDYLKQAASALQFT